MRAACGARDGLGVEAAVGGVVILGGAGGVERPGMHRRAGAIVRQAEDHGVARAATGAVDIGIAIAEIRRVGEIRQAFGAYRQIGRDADAGVPVRVAVANGEFGEAGGLSGLNVDRDDLRGGRTLRGEAADECIERRSAAFKMNFDAVLIVADPTGQRVRLRKAEHEGTEADALDDATNSNIAGSRHFHVIQRLRNRGLASRFGRGRRPPRESVRCAVRPK